jgi:DNA invertase Pin-like site-specific DNA recombinase
MAEMERSVILERVTEGLAYARQHGTRLGRAVGRPRAVFRRDEVAALRQQELSLRQTAAKVGRTAHSQRQRSVQPSAAHRCDAHNGSST